MHLTYAVEKLDKRYIVQYILPMYTVFFSSQYINICSIYIYIMYTYIQYIYIYIMYTYIHTHNIYIYILCIYIYIYIHTYAGKTGDISHLLVRPISQSFIAYQCPLGYIRDHEGASRKISIL